MFRAFVAAKRKALRELERDVTLSWQQANWTAAAWAGKLPSLDSVLVKLRPTSPQSSGELKTMVHALAAHYGLTVIQRKRVPVDG